MTMVDNDDNSQTDLFDDEDLFDALDMMNDTTIKQDKHLCTNCQSSNITNDYSKGCVRCTHRTKAEMSGLSDSLIVPQNA